MGKKLKFRLFCMLVFGIPCPSWASFPVRCDLVLRATLGVVESLDFDLRNSIPQNLRDSLEILKLKTPSYSESLHSPGYIEFIQEFLVKIQEPWVPATRAVPQQLAIVPKSVSQKWVLITGGQNVGKSTSRQALFSNAVLESAGQRDIVFVPEVATLLLEAGVPPPLEAGRHPWDAVLFQTLIALSQNQLDQKIQRWAPADSIVIFDRSLTDGEAFFKGVPIPGGTESLSEFLGFSYRDAIHRFDHLFFFILPPSLGDLGAFGRDPKLGNAFRFRDDDEVQKIFQQNLELILKSDYPDSQISFVGFYEDVNEKLQFLKNEFSRVFNEKIKE